MATMSSLYGGRRPAGDDIATGRLAPSDSRPAGDDIATGRPAPSDILIAPCSGRGKNKLG